MPPSNHVRTGGGLISVAAGLLLLLSHLLDLGGDQERLVDLRGERLTLSTRPLLLRGIQQTAHLTWERVSTSNQ